jgi:hypothetical protein
VLFHPDPRSIRRQKFCSKPECRKASKAENQRRWLEKPENQDYFRGPENVQRVQQWRREHPGYWRRNRPGSENALQDPLSEKKTKKQVLMPELTTGALQDLLSAQAAVLIGLIAKLTGYALQDDIAMTARHLQQLGNEFLHHPIHFKGGSHGKKIPHMSAARPKGPYPVQLGGSPSGS